MVSFTRLRVGPRVLPRATSFVLWGLAFGCAAYWALQMGNAKQSPSTVAATGFAVNVDGKQVAKLLGQQESAPVNAASSRYDLLGVVRNGGGGAALISVDGKPARTVVVGRAVAEGSDVMLSALGARSATLQPKDGAAITLDMPALASAFTDTGSAPSGAKPPVAAPALSPGFTPPGGQQSQPAPAQPQPGAAQQTARFQGPPSASMRAQPNPPPGFQVSSAPGAQAGSRARPGAMVREDSLSGSQVALRSAAASAASTTAPVGRGD